MRLNYKCNQIIICSFLLYIQSVYSKLFYNHLAEYKINLIINGTGNQKILSDKYYGVLPDEILVNNIIPADTGYNLAYNLYYLVNEISLIWDPRLTSFKSLTKMFYNMSNILEVDLSNFDSSNVERMDYMFYNCTSLTSINFNNKFKTNNVNNMHSMFSGCISLFSLDLNNFVYSKIKILS